MATKKTSIDWVLVGLLLLLITIGWFAIYTADFDETNASIFNTARSYGRQLQWIGVALVIAFFIQLLNTGFFVTLAYPIYLSAMSLLLMVLLMGATISGSQSWFKLGAASLQPSEIGKYATAIVLARYLSSLNSGTHFDFDEQVTVAGIIALPTLLVLLQGDAGSALVFSAFALTLYREGLSGLVLVLAAFMATVFVLALLVSFDVLVGVLATILLIVLAYRRKATQQDILIFVAAALFMFILSHIVSQAIFLLILFFISVVILFFYFNTRRLVFFMIGMLFAIGMYVKSVDYAYNEVLKPHQKNRIGVILGIIEDKKGVGYNLNQSKIAIGSGGLWGKGFLQGTQNKGDFVPEIHTDFIFCTIGEEFGFMGSLGFIGIFVLLLIKIVNVAERQRSRFARIYGYSVASILFFHFAVNISMTIGLMPVIGIPLPFVSYGGSSLIGFTLLTFTLVKLDSERLMYL